MITIRKMETNDIPCVSELMCSCYRWLGGENNFSDGQIDFLVSDRGSVDRITIESQKQVYLVAFLNRCVVGVVAINANEVAKLFVDPDYFGQGVGTELLCSAERIIADGCYKEMVVGVMAQSAIGFYEQRGMIKYREKKLKTGAFSGCKIPMMRKPLT
jgi:ribosomal protein S18 acetylase RimI-like enzyme